MPRHLIVALLAATTAYAAADVPKWTRFEVELQGPEAAEDPLALDVTAEFRGPSGSSRTVPGFWDGGRTWRVRFSPDEVGRWTFQTRGPVAGLSRKGEFRCTAPTGRTVFEKHGPVTVSADKRRFAHRDGTPFFWLADTAWNGPLLATDADWQHYLDKRNSQGFTAVQWVATQWRGSPSGDADGRLAYSGPGPIHVNLEFFRQLERKHETILRSGLLSVPVMLWAIATRNGPEVNPGLSLPERDASLLARYMLARWGSDPVVWLLNGDGDYRGPKAERWKNIGRAVFEGVWHAPVSLHPGGRMWVMDEFREEKWLDVAAYQSAHGDSEANSEWIHSGPPAEEWRKSPVRPVISLEAPYERPSDEKAPNFDALVRRNHLWSLMNAPVSGITYGVHGIWGWSDGVHPAPGHGTTVWPHWKTLLDLPGALQIGRIRRVLESMEWVRLDPAPSVLASQPGGQAFVSVVQTPGRERTVVYTPKPGEVRLAPESLPSAFQAEWVSAASGERAEAAHENAVFTTPGEGDWLLLIRSAKR